MTKILIIEDDRFLRELMSRKLEEEGYEVFEAINGEQGLKQAKENKPDVILLDVMMPGINGFEVLSKIKGDSVLSLIPVIMLSNLDQKEDAEKALKLGAADYLVKAHFTPGEIIEKIQKVLK